LIFSKLATMEAAHRRRRLFSRPLGQARRSFAPVFATDSAIRDRRRLPRSRRLGSRPSVRTATALGRGQPTDIASSFRLRALAVADLAWACLAAFVFGPRDPWATMLVFEPARFARCPKRSRSHAIALKCSSPPNGSRVELPSWGEPSPPTTRG